MNAFMKYGMSSENKKAQMMEREICETLHNIQNSFYSEVNAFTALEKNHHEIVGKIKPGIVETKLHDLIVRIIVL